MAKSLFGVVAALIISWGVFFGHALGANITASWTYDYNPMAACSTSRASNCIDHFEILDITDQNKAAMIRSVGNPRQASSKVEKVSADFKYGPPFGQRAISVIAVGRDRNGIRISSDSRAAQATVSIHPLTKMSVLF